MVVLLCPGDGLLNLGIHSGHSSSLCLGLTLLTSLPELPLYSLRLPSLAPGSQPSMPWEFSSPHHAAKRQGENTLFKSHYLSPAFVLTSS